MPLTPEEIADKDFVVGLRGYDKDEVRNFLQLVAAELLVHQTAAPAGDAAPDTADEERAEAEGLAAKIVADALQGAGWIRTEAEADAELVRAEAATVLRDAQDEALRLVAETRNLAERVTGVTGAARQQVTAAAPSADLTEQISQLEAARATVGQLLADLTTQLDSAVATVAAASAVETEEPAGSEDAPGDVPAPA